MPPIPDASILTSEIDKSPHFHEEAISSHYLVYCESGIILFAFFIFAREKALHMR